VWRKVYGHRVYRWRPGTLGRNGPDGAGIEEIGETPGRTVMSVDLFYGLGAILSGLLLAYLVYALFRAEEF